MPRTNYAGLAARPTTRRGSKPPPAYDQIERQFKARKTDGVIDGEAVVISLCVDNRTRVRIGTRTEQLGLNQGKVTYARTSFYLDGQMLTEEFYGNGIVKREWTAVGENVIPTRSKAVVDFGRLDQAVQGLVTIMGRINESGKEPDPDQISSLYVSRENVLEWQRRAHAEMATADSQVDLMEAMFRQVIVGKVVQT